VRFWVIILSLAVAAAQTPPAGSKVVAGEITTVDANAKQIKVKADDGTSYTVALQDNTIYLRMPLGETDQKKAEKIALSDVTIGDRILTRGPISDGNTVTVKTVITMTKGDVAKKQQQDAADWQKRGIAGTITEVNAGAKEITIDTHGRGAKNVVVELGSASLRRYAPDSVRFADAKVGSFDQLQPGDTVRALGNKSEDGTHYKAEELLSGSFLTIAATVVSVNAANGDVIVTDLKTKKPVTIHTNPNTMLRRLEERTAAFLARRLHADAGGPGVGGPGAGGPGAGGPGAGGPGAGGPGGAGPGAGGPPGGMRGAFCGQGGPGGGRGPGGPGGPGAGSDLQQILDHSPQLALAELKKGDALIISSTKGSDGGAMTAFSLVAGVEPFLAAAPRTAGQVDLGSWNLGAGAPEQ